MNLKTIKRHMTLLEVLIAMSLLSVLLVIVFGFFSELSFLNNKTKQTSEQAFQQRYVESRLFYLFSHIVNENDTNRTFYFFVTNDETSKHPSLVLTFDNGDVSDPRFSHDLVGRLFVDADKQLCLAMWPLKSPTEDVRSVIKMEYLLKGVEDLHFSFFVPPDTANDVEPSNSKETVLPHQGEWVRDEWSKDYQQMPAIVKIEVKLEKNREELFAFVLPSSKHPITFVPKK